MKTYSELTLDDKRVLLDMIQRAVKAKTNPNATSKKDLFLCPDIRYEVLEILESLEIIVTTSQLFFLKELGFSDYMLYSMVDASENVVIDPAIHEYLFPPKREKI